LRRPKHIQREIIDLQLAQQQQDLLEDALSAEPSEPIKPLLPETSLRANTG